jgi:hypothetical protein
MKILNFADASIRACLKIEMLAALSSCKSGWYFGNLFLDKIYKLFV